MGQPLRQVRLPGDALAIGIRRQGDIVVPHGETVLRRGDVMMLVGSADAILQAQSWLRGAAADSAPGPALPQPQVSLTGQE